MRRIILLIILLITAYFFTFDYINNFNKKDSPVVEAVKINENNPLILEKITYDVSLGSFYLGTSVFRSLSKVNLSGKEANLMTFQTSLMNFTDSEVIYSDPDSNLPLRVERVILSWPNKEKIIEDYDQKNFTLTIKKIKGKSEETKIIQKENVINNTVLLPFYVRHLPIFNENGNLDVEFPTQRFKVMLAGKEEVVVPAGKFLAYRFESQPANFEIWISADECRIPIKIKKTDGLSYTLAMKEYTVL
ncbi:MAG: hypothetical protein AB1755_03835 [Candidatus Omnitrophota bacterium]